MFYIFDAYIFNSRSIVFCILAVDTSHFVGNETIEIVNQLFPAVGCNSELEQRWLQYADICYFLLSINVAKLHRMQNRRFDQQNVITVVPWITTRNQL